MSLIRSCLVWSVLAAAALPARAEAPAAAVAVPPVWMYPVNPAAGADVHAAAGRERDPRPIHLPESARAFTLAAINDPFNVPDWYPGEHAPMPGIVAHGRRPDLMACGYCHLPDGAGRPENASLAGLPADYIVRQVADMKAGLRKSSGQPHTPPYFMREMVAKQVTDAEVRRAAAYFARLQPRHWIRVVETDTVPATHVAAWTLVPDRNAAPEPIGERVIEVAEDFERFEARDAHSRYIAYAPPGSVRRGEALARAGHPDGLPACSSCHGERLQGSGLIPRLAGRSPSYLARQLWDFRSGARAGATAQPMIAVAARLGVSDMVDVVAYLASLD